MASGFPPSEIRALTADDLDTLIAVIKRRNDG